MKRFLFIAALYLLVSLVNPVFADGHHMGHGTGNIHIMQPWSRATPPGSANGAVFMTVVNKGHQADRLISVSSDIAKKVELHTHKMDGDIMRMRHVDDIRVDTGASVALKPGGYHVMLMGLKKPLKKGETFSLTLEFQHAGKKTINVPIHKIGAMKPKSSSGMHHQH